MGPLLCPAARSLPPERLGGGAEVRVLLRALSTQHPTHTSGCLQAWEVRWEGWGGPSLAVESRAQEEVSEASFPLRVLHGKASGMPFTCSMA